MIQKMQKIAVTEDSWPFISAERACGLKEYGYVEEEFFQTGTANIYDEDENGALSVTFPAGSRSTISPMTAPSASG